MRFIKAYVHDPGGNESQPTDGDHHPDLELCQLMGKAIDIDQPHVGGYTCQCPYCHPAKNIFSTVQNMSPYPKLREVIIKKYRACFTKVLWCMHFLLFSFLAKMGSKLK